MTRVAVALTGPRQVALVHEPDEPLGPREVRLRTLLSGVSRGTELAAYRGSSPFLAKRWDPERRLFLDAEPSVPAYPLTSWGYEEVGEVVEAGSQAGLALGTRVYGAWGHCSHRVVAADWAAQRILPPGVDPALGIFSHIGATALNAVLDAAPRLRETVVVFGLGVVGQLIGQLLGLTGARVIGVEPLAKRSALARSLGMPEVLDPTARSPAPSPAQSSAESAAESHVESPAERIRALTDGRGADVCVEASGVPAALHEAVRACAPTARVVAVGFYQGGADALRLGEEFHHNRVNLVSSQIGGVAPELSLRWDRQRLVHTFMRLAVAGRVRCADLITHRVGVANAAEVFRLLDQQPGEVLQAVLDFGACE
jgi:2-desacetyl-2-hydroxyethyl bacteriochlorophyllide A dehydrogenase